MSKFAIYLQRFAPLSVEKKFFLSQNIVFHLHKITVNYNLT